jgi:hypothetical protein
LKKAVEELIVAEDTKKPRLALRAGIAVALGLMIAAYTLLVVTGLIPKDRRIDTVDLVIIVVGALCCVVLVKPDLTDRLRLLEVKGFKVELLERIQERQIRQEHELEDIRLIFPLLFRDSERKHLSNLTRGKTAGYHGGAPLREELRRLCSIGLLQRRGLHYIGELRNDMVFDLSDYVELTDLGRRWVHRLAELDAAAGDLSEATE